MRLLWLRALVAFCTLVAAAPVAHAQSGVAKALHDDLTNIVEQLVMAKTGRALSRGGSKHPAACFYFRAAFDRLEANQWGLVGPALRDGLASLTEDFAYWLSTQNASQDREDVTSDLQAFFKERNAQLVGTKPTACNSETWKDVRSLVDQNCPPATSSAACQIARWARASVRTDDHGARAAASTLALDLLLQNKPELFAGAELEWEQLRSVRKQSVRSALVRLLSGDEDWVDHIGGFEATCKPTLEDLLRAPQGGVRAPFSDLCLAAFVRDLRSDVTAKLVVVPKGKPGVSLSADALVDFLIALRAKPKKALEGALGEDAAEVQEFDVTVGGKVLQHVKLTNTGPKFTPARPVVRVKALERLYEARIEPLLEKFGVRGVGATTDVIRLAFVATLHDLAARLRSAAGAVIPDEQPDPGRMLLAALELDSAGGLSAKRIHGVLSERIFRFEKREDLLPYIELIRRSIQVPEEYKKHADLLFHMAAYLVSQDSASGSVAREAFRASAVALLAEHRSPGFPMAGNWSATWPPKDRVMPAPGEEANTKFSWKNWGASLITPSLGLRVSWNNTYTNEIGSNGVRYMPSVEWLTVFRWGITEYSGIQISTIDLAAPLSEYAMRPEAAYEYDRPLLPLADAIRPRLEGYVGIPELSRDVVAVGGLGLRLIRADVGDKRYEWEASAELSLGVLVLL